jgi:hypothetical protein
MPWFAAEAAVVEVAPSPDPATPGVEGPLEQAAAAKPRPSSAAATGNR